VGGVATSAELGTVTDAAFDVSGDVFIADAGNDLVQFVPRTTAEFYGGVDDRQRPLHHRRSGLGSSHFSAMAGRLSALSSPDHLGRSGPAVVTTSVIPARAVSATSR